MGAFDRFMSSQSRQWSKDLWDGLIQAIDARFAPVEEQIDAQKQAADAIVSRGLQIIEDELEPVLTHGDEVVVAIDANLAQSTALVAEIEAALAELSIEGNIPAAAITTNASARFTSDTEMNGKMAAALKGAANGVAELDSGSLVPLAQLPTGASKLATLDGSGKVTAAMLPNPSASTLGGVRSIAVDGNKFLNSIGTDGVPVAAAIAASAISDSTATGRSLLTAADAAAARAVLSVSAPVTAPQGRLTLASGEPVMSSSVSAATAIYYTPHIGQYIPLWNGTNIDVTAFGELTNTLTDATKNPAAVAANKVYDLFVWNDGGTLRLSRGPAWTNDTTRGYSLTRNGGFLTNGSAITNGPAAGRGTYVGTAISDGASKFNFVFGSTAAGGGGATLGVWNAYNRVRVATEVKDSAATWSSSGSNFHAAHGSSTYRTTFVVGLAHEAFDASYMATAYSDGADVSIIVGVALDATNTTHGVRGVSTVYDTSDDQVSIGSHSAIPSAGKHYVQAIENAPTSVTIYGQDYGGLSFKMAM